MERAGMVERGYTTRGAANLLGVSQREVVRLIEADKISARLTESGFYVIDELSLSSYRLAKRAKGRPWAADTAWAALDLLGGGDAGWLDYRRRWSLMKKLETCSAEDVVWLARNRQTLRRYKCSPSVAPLVKKSVIRTGSASSASTMHVIGLSEAPSLVDGYVAEGLLDKLADAYCMREGTRGEVTLRVAHGLPSEFSRLAEMPPAVAAADLALSANVREHDCGLNYLEGLLDEYKQNRHQ